MTSKDIFTKYDEIIKNDIRQSISKKGLTASGKSARTLRSEITDTSYTLYGEDYFEQLQNGRMPTRSGGPKGSGQLQDIIREWIDQKGINPTDISKDSLAYLITRKIHREGIKVPKGATNPGLNNYNPGGVISDVINKELIEQIEGELSALYFTNIQSEIKNILNVK